MPLVPRPHSRTVGLVGRVWSYPNLEALKCGFRAGARITGEGTGPSCRWYFGISEERPHMVRESGL